MAVAITQEYNGNNFTEMAVALRRGSGSGFTQEQCQWPRFYFSSFHRLATKMNFF
jgi:hypothetical protein